MPGILGFTSEDQLTRLLLSPNARGSAVTALDDRFVVTLSLFRRESVSLSEEELELLKRAVQQVLFFKALR